MSVDPILSVVILTRDEEANLSYCLESLRGLNADVHIVDSGSTDRTLEIAKSYGAKVYFRTFDNHARQFNWAIDHLPIRTEWCMRMDADEILLPGLVEELKEKLPRAKRPLNGFVMNRRMYFWGRWIRHGGFYPMWMVRIWRTGSGRCEDRWMDEHMIIKEGVVERLANDFVDENHKDLTFWTQKHNLYANREAIDRMTAEKAGPEAHLTDRESILRRKFKSDLYCKLPLFIRPVIYWAYRYIVRLGFLDGVPGLVFHFLHACWYQFLIDAKIYEAKKNKSRKN